MPKARIYFDSRKTESDFDDGILLSEIIKSSECKLPFQCGGRGVCGKCKVKVIGILSELTNDEKRRLSTSEVSEGVRLACRAKAYGDVDIYIDSPNDVIGITDHESQYSPTDPLTGDRDAYCACFDIGTTTVAGLLYHFPDGVFVNKICVENPQRKYGADVISRLEYAQNGGLETLKNEIRGCIDSLSDSFNVKIDYRIITGNTVMLHLFSGCDVSGMMQYPFLPKSLFGEWLCGDYIAPCVSSFIGADTVCATDASGMMKDRCSMLVDIGTNGEIVLNHNGRVVATSVAAGPVFEGYGISCGMPYSKGAISRVYFQKGKLCFDVVGDTVPTGLCGTGVIDGIAAGLSCGKIDADGSVVGEFVIADNVSITQSDIRAVQSAKSAIRSGIDILLSEFGLSYGDVDSVYLAGGFGSALNISSAAFIGLIPYEFISKTKTIGNAAVAGASHILFDKKARNTYSDIAESIKVVNLACNDSFEKTFISNMRFNNV